jgi:glutamyl-tRNA reductase
MPRLVSDAPLARLHVLALAARDLPAAARDAIFVEGEAQAALQDALMEAGAGELVVFSTCDRIELLIQAETVDAARLAETLIDRLGLPADAAGCIRVHHGADALRALFAAAASLDSDTVGDPNVLGQLKAAHRLAKASGAIGPGLETVLQAAYAAAKRVRTGTAVGELPVSLASVARQVARDIFGALSERGLLILGTGEMGADLARHFVAGGIGPIAATSPMMAERFDAHLIPDDALADGLDRADIVVCATESRTVALSEADIRAALKRRKRRPLFLIDVALPADVDPAVDRLENVFRYDLNDLERLSLENRARRGVSAVEGWAIVEAELEAFLTDGGARRAVPAIEALRARFEAERQAVLASVPPDKAEEATRLLVNRLLHGPISSLRRHAADGDLEAARALLEDFFDLPGAEAEAPATRERKRDR